MTCFNSVEGVWRRVRWVVPAAMLLACVGTSWAQDWPTVEVIGHNEYQAVDAAGASGYSQTFPVRLRGVVLNDNQDWLDPTGAYNETPWDLGGQAEFFVQAVDLDGTPHDDVAASYDDFGGTAVWIGQCYGNLPWIGDPEYNNYPDGSGAPDVGTPPGWHYELDRLGFWRPGTATDAIGAGDLIEIRARAGLYYSGKMNVNEQHNNLANDFEIVLLEQGYGLPAPAPLELAELKDAADVAIFDPTRQAGGEHYQATRVELQGVELVDATGWGPESDLVLADTTGRTLDVHLGLDESYSTLPAPEGPFDVVGILDQNSSSGQDGYRLLVMDAGDFATVPESGSLALLTAGMAAGLMWGLRCRPLAGHETTVST